MRHYLDGVIDAQHQRGVHKEREKRLICNNLLRKVEREVINNAEFSGPIYGLIYSNTSRNWRIFSSLPSETSWKPRIVCQNRVTLFSRNTMGLGLEADGP